MARLDPNVGSDNDRVIAEMERQFSEGDGGERSSPPGAPNIALEAQRLARLAARYSAHPNRGLAESRGEYEWFPAVQATIARRLERDVSVAVRRAYLETARQVAVQQSNNLAHLVNATRHADNVVVGVDMNIPWGLVRVGVLTALGLVALAAIAVLQNLAVGLALIYVALGVFCFSDYAAWRTSAERWFLPPRIALVGMFGTVGLAITMLIANFQ